MNPLQILYNGGADPTTADLRELRQRRAIALSALLMLPLGSVVMVSTLLRSNLFDALAIVPSLVFAAATLALLLRNRRGTPRVAAQCAIATLFLAPCLTMIDSGLSGVSWIWFTAIPVAAALLGGRASGMLWTLAAMGAIQGFAWAHANGLILKDLGTDWQLVAPEMPLLLLALCVVTQAFLGAQEKSEHALRDALDAARQAEATKSRFLATMSHELRTPLNGVLGTADLIRADNLDATQHELLDTMNDSAQVLLDLINDVLDLSRIDAGGMRLEAVPVDPAALLRQVAAPLRLQAGRKDVAVHVDIADDVPAWIAADPTRLRQILMNLGGNAVKFTDAGEVRLAAATATIDGQPRLVLTVRDTGVGITAAQQAGLFQPFAQAEASTARHYGGTGLGLSIVRSLAGLMGGTVTLASEPGTGSTFTVCIPLRATEAPAVAPDTAAGVDIGVPDAALHVLLVDDNAVNRAVGRKLLQRLGHTVVEAVDGQAALAILAATPVDLVLMDVQMPVLDGLEATRRLRADGNRVPVVGLSANASEDDLAEAHAAGMDGYLAKPIRLALLRDALAPWVESAARSAGRRDRGAISSAC